MGFHKKPPTILSEFFVIRSFSLNKRAGERTMGKHSAKIRLIVTCVPLNMLKRGSVFAIGCITKKKWFLCLKDEQWRNVAVSLFWSPLCAPVPLNYFFTTVNSTRQPRWITRKTLIQSNFLVHLFHPQELPINFMDLRVSIL